MRTLPPISPAIVFATCLAAVSAHAQSPDLIEQSRLRSSLSDFRPEAPVGISDALSGGTDESLGESADEQEEGALETPGDFDLGVQLIMKPKERNRPLRLFATIDDFFTSNVALAKHDPQSDNYLFAEIGARYETKLSEALGFEATVRQAIFRYNKYRSFDFESLNVGAGVGYKVPELADVTLFARYNCERLTRDDFGDEFFLNQTLSVGAQKSWIYKETHAFFVGYSSLFGFSDPAASERDEHSLFGGAHLPLIGKLDGDLYCRLAYFDFHNGQHDMNQLIAPSLTYHLSPSCDLGVSFSFVLNRSNRSRFDYENLTTGGGLTLTGRF